MTADTLALDTEFTPHRLRCDRCGRTIDCTPADFRVYVAIGPPRCCGRPMAFPPPFHAHSTDRKQQLQSRRRTPENFRITATKSAF